MKKLCLSILTFYSLFSLRAQTVTPTVLSSDGGFSQTSQGSIAWTIGESISETYSNSLGITTMGFHQPDMGIISITMEHTNDQAILVYPNPLISELSIDFKQSNEGLYHLKMMDALGKLMFEKDISVYQFSNINKINLSEFASGNYFLTIYNQQLSKTIKITKLD